MKKIIETTIAIKNFAAMTFTGIVMIFTVVGYFFGLTAIRFSFIWQAIFISLICGALYYIAFSDNVIREMRYSFRLMLFALPLYAVVSIFAAVFQWFVVSWKSWIIFTLIFFALFGIFIGAFYLFFKITGKRYNEMLSLYKSTQGK